MYRHIPELLHGMDKDDKTKDLIITEKGKLKWRGDLPALQLFLDEALNIKGNWTTASGAKILKNDKATIRWYSQNESLTIGGTDAETVKRSLELRAGTVYSAENSEMGSITKPKHFDGDKSEASELNTNEGESPGSLNIIVKGLKIELTELKRQFDTYRTNNNQAIKTLQDKQDERIYGEKENENHKLREENYKLNRENKDLNERIINLENKLADSNGKIRTADEEKASLITAIRLLQYDIDSEHSVKTSNKHTAWIKSGSKEEGNRKYRHKYMNTKGTQSQSTKVNKPIKEVLTSNRYLSLEIDESQSPIDVSSDNCSDDEKNNGEAASEKKSQKSNREIAPSKNSQDLTTSPSQKPRSSNRRKKKKTVVIAGDSIVKNIIGASMSGFDDDHFFVVKSFPGATLEDMKDFIKPLIKRQPDKLILHAGTNNLRNSSPRTIADSIVNLAAKIKEESSNTDVGISGLLVRNDNTDLASKVNLVNKILFDYCNLNQIPFLGNTNINTSHLNSRGLHLNKRGSTTLQNNLRQFARDIHY